MNWKNYYQCNFSCIILFHEFQCKIKFDFLIFMNFERSRLFPSQYCLQNIKSCKHSCRNCCRWFPKKNFWSQAVCLSNLTFLIHIYAFFLYRNMKTSILFYLFMIFFIEYENRHNFHIYILFNKNKKMIFFYIFMLIYIEI